MNQPKSQKANKNKNHEQLRGTRIIPTCRNGCKNSKRILWMKEFLNTETHTRVFLMNLFWSPWGEVRVWVYTVLKLISRKTEIARSARGPKSQGPRAEDVLAESYFVQKNLVIWLQPITKFSVKVVNLETINDMQSWCKTWPPNGSSRIRAKQKLLRKPKRACKSSWSRIGSLKSFTLTIPWNLTRPVKIFPGINCTSTPHRSQTNGSAERAVRRVKEGTSAVLLQSGLDEKWWADSMECYTCLRNIQDLFSDGKTPYERRFGKPFWRTNHSVWFTGWVLPYNCEGSVKNPSIWKVLPGLFLGYALYAGIIWKGDIMVAYIEELETMDASEIYSERLNAKEVIFPKENGKFRFPVADGRKKSLEEIRNWEHPPWYGITQFEENVKEIFLENQKGLHLHDLKTHFRMPVKHEMISGPFQETSYTAITLNPESNFTRREKNHSLFHWNTLTSPELHIQTWMLCLNAASMIIGITMDQEICQILGQVSHNLHYWKKNFLTGIWGPGRD